MIIYKSFAETELIRESCKIVNDAIALVASLIKPGVSTMELNDKAEEYIRSQGATPSFKNYSGFPYACCMSVNDAVVHGFPTNDKLKDGDVISVDVGAYKNNQLDRTFIASKIFNDDRILAKINAIVHPKVGIHFKRWVKKQTSEYVIKEAAIIFEQQKQSDYDYIITVTASMQTRISRLLKRDDTTKDKIMAIVKNQMSDDEKIEKSDFVINNERLELTKLKVIEIHQYILQIIQKT